jgi:hypothetical protein
MASAFREDLKRYRHNGKLQWHEPSLYAVAVYRVGQWIGRVRPRAVSKHSVVSLPAGGDKTRISV